MALVTKSQVLSFAKTTMLRKAMDSSSVLREEAAAKLDSYDIFLSHSYLDKDLILGTKKFLESKNLSVYVDWIDDKQLDRSKVTPETADTLRKTMNKCSCLIYAYSANVAQSRWCPWELGYFDGRNGKSYVLPLVDSASDKIDGIEFVGLYMKIVELKAKSGNMSLFIDAPNEWIHLNTAIKK